MSALKSISNGVKQQLSARNRTASSTAAESTSGPIFARFFCPNKFEYFMRKTRVTVGRTSAKSQADVDMGYSSFISRNHVEVYMDDKKFYALVTGKNGVFVDNVFHRKGGAPFELGKLCVIRFPSTELRIQFKVMLDEAPPSTPSNFVTPVTKPLKNGNTPANQAAVLKNQQQQQQQQQQQLLQLYREQQMSKATTSSDYHDIQSPSFSDHIVSPDSGQMSSMNLLRKVKPIDVGDERQMSKGIKRPREMTVDLGDDDWSGGSGDKPPYSYAQLIIQAICSQKEKQLTLNGIYNYISQKYPYYRASDKGWQNSIRHNLSLNRYFMKVARGHDESGKGSFWRIDPAAEPSIFVCAFKRKRKSVGSTAATLLGVNNNPGRATYSRTGSLELNASSTLQQIIDPDMLGVMGSDAGSSARYTTEDSLISLSDSMDQSDAATTLRYVSDPASTNAIQYLTDGNMCYTIVSLVEDPDAPGSLSTSTTTTLASIQNLPQLIQSGAQIIDIGEGVGINEAAGEMREGEESYFTLDTGTEGVEGLIDGSAEAAGSASSVTTIQYLLQQHAAAAADPTADQEFLEMVDENGCQVTEDGQIKSETDNAVSFIEIVPDEAAAEATEAAVEGTKAAVEDTEAAVDATEAAVEATEAAVETTEAAVEATEAAVETTEAAVEATEAAVETTEDAVETAEAAVDAGSAVEADAEAAENAAIECNEAAADTDKAAVVADEAAAVLADDAAAEGNEVVDETAEVVDEAAAGGNEVADETAVAADNIDNTECTKDSTADAVAAETS